MRQIMVSPGTKEGTWVAGMLFGPRWWINRYGQAAESVTTSCTSRGNRRTGELIDVGGGMQIMNTPPSGIPYRCRVHRGGETQTSGYSVAAGSVLKRHMAPWSMSTALKRANTDTRFARRLLKPLPITTRLARKGEQGLPALRGPVGQDPRS